MSNSEGLQIEGRLTSSHLPAVLLALMRVWSGQLSVAAQTKHLISRDMSIFWPQVYADCIIV